MAILYLLSSALQKDIMMAADNKQGKERTAPATPGLLSITKTDMSPKLKCPKTKTSPKLKSHKQKLNFNQI